MRKIPPTLALSTQYSRKIGSKPWSQCSSCIWGDEVQSGQLLYIFYYPPRSLMKFFVSPPHCKSWWESGPAWHNRGLEGQSMLAKENQSSKDRPMIQTQLTVDFCLRLRTRTRIHSHTGSGSSRVWWGCLSQVLSGLFYPTSLSHHSFPNVVDLLSGVPINSPSTYFVHSEFLFFATKNSPNSTLAEKGRLSKYGISMLTPGGE